MRIISGIFKGKKILIPKDIKTRPLKDLTKESIFNIITHSNKFRINIKDSNILDLFSGVGSFGIECLSRGVRKVIFVENYNGVLPILKKNLNTLNFKTNYEIIEKNIYDINTFKNLNLKFDIIFLDPPYKDRNTINILTNISENKILDENGVVIVHRHKNEEILIPSNYIKIEEKKYGISKIFFIKFK